MAVLSIAPGITAEILVNNAPIKEYVYEDEQVQPSDDPTRQGYLKDRTVTKYIQSETNEIFSIRLTVGAPYIRGTYMVDTRLSFLIFFDGNYISTSSVHRRWFRNKEVGIKWEDIVEGVISTESNVRKLKTFKFAPLIVKHGDSEKADTSTSLAEEVRKVGIIRIEVYGETGGKQVNVEKKVRNIKRPGGGEVPETSMKGEIKSHSIAFGEAVVTKKSAQDVIAKRTSEGFPLVVFQFLYKDHDTLRKYQVIKDPASEGNDSLEDRNQASSCATSSPSVPASMSDAELLQAMRSFLENHAGPSHGFPVAADTKKEVRNHLKREATGEEGLRNGSVKTRRLTNGGSHEKVVVDLTEDD